MSDIDPGDECYHLYMRQLISRIDDRLHGRLKERAKEEGRSVNSLVTEMLERGLAVTPRERMRERVRSMGRLTEPPPADGPVPTAEEALEAGRGWGSAVSEALEADRRRR